MNIYKEIILEHWRNPHNFGKVNSPDFKLSNKNTFCGDEIEVSGKLKGSAISQIKFKGNGCVISQVAASLLTDFVRGKNLQEITNISSQDVVRMLGVELSPTRMKCAELSLIVIKNAVHGR